MALPFFAITLFVAAFQLFLVQPMIGKMILPKLGGTPQVWNTCMVFFQSALLAGYAYTHTVSTRLTLRQQIMLHCVLLLLPFLVLLPNGPFNVSSFTPTTGGNPIPATLLLLALIVGLPFFVVATSAPLLQKWFAATGHPAAKDPYFLYGASNFGSMLSLLLYPVVIEPWLPLSSQAYTWTAGYVFFVLMFLGCALMAWRATPSLRLAATGGEAPPAEVPAAASATQISESITAKAPATASVPKPAPSTAFTKGKRKGKGPARTLPAPVSAPAHEWVEAPPSDNVTNFRRLRWVLLAAVPSSLMLGTTTSMSVDLSPIPLLWIVPLALYLLTFILVFLRWPVPWTRGPHTFVVLAQPIFVLSLCLVVFLAGAVTGEYLGRAIGLMMLAFFSTALMCHGELARDRPSVRYLTEFYLWMSVGGMLGGMFNALVAPVMFNFVLEYPIAVVLGVMLRPMGRSLAPIDKRSGAILGGVFGFFFALALYGTLLPSITQFLVVLLIAGAGAVLGMVLQPPRKETNATDDFLRTTFPGIEAWAQRAGQDWARSFSKTVKPTSVYVLSYALDIILPLLVGMLSFVLIFNGKDGRKWAWLYPDEDINPMFKLLQTLGFSKDFALEHYYPMPGTLLVFGIPLIICFFFANRGLRFGLALGMVLLVNGLYERERSGLLAAGRSFFGVLRVGLEVSRTADGRPLWGPYTNLTHGTTLHGQNFRHPDLKRIATTYYHQYGPGGRVMEFFNWFKDDTKLLNEQARKALGENEANASPRLGRLFDRKDEPIRLKWNADDKDRRPPYESDARIYASLWGLSTDPYAQLGAFWSEPPYATIGLGTGTMASYARPTQHMHFYEIDRYIREFSLPKDDSEPFFTYLKEARKRGATIQVLMGDARLRMGQPYATYDDAADVVGEGKGGGPDNFYHMIVVDAFSSDAIPVHLITKESIEMYMRKLVPHGVLCVHISNRHLDLAPVVANVARSIVMEDPDQIESTITAEKGSSGAIALPGDVWKEPLALSVDAKGALVLGKSSEAKNKICLISHNDGWYYAEPADAAGKAHINGTMLGISQKLRAGDVISAGDVAVTFTQKGKDVPLVSMRGHHDAPYGFIGDSGQVWVMVSRSKKVLEKLYKLEPPGHEEAVRQRFRQRVVQPYWEYLTFDDLGRLNPYGIGKLRNEEPRYLGRPWTDDYSNVIGALR